MRLAVGVEYCGRDFSGWQRQSGARTVQGCLEEALGRIAGHEIVLQCAGRTDAGVHASYQVAHFDTPVERPMPAWTLGANTHLPADTGVVWSRPVPVAFHARYGAVRRRYRYLVLNRRARSGLWEGRVAWEPRPLDENAMAAAARFLLGEHDFTSYRARGCQASSPRRCLYRLDVRRKGNWVIVEAEANAFLQRMVRNLAGVLLTIGLGRRRPVWARQVLLARARECGGYTAPPQGLYLADVRYPRRFRLPRPTRPPSLP